jgi:hypothetical protein
VNAHPRAGDLLETNGRSAARSELITTDETRLRASKGNEGHQKQGRDLTMREIALLDLWFGESEEGGGSCGRDSSSADRISKRRRSARDSGSRAKPMRRTMRWHINEMPSHISGLIAGASTSLILLSATFSRRRLSLEHALQIELNCIIWPQWDIQ